jgi:hypothetical protein
MSTSSSSASSVPAISVVIGSNAPRESVEACLAALESQREGIEVLVVEGEPSAAKSGAAKLASRFPWARFVERPGALVPELWRDGIDTASGNVVALTIAQMEPAPDWIARLRDLHGRYDVVGGAIDPGRGLRPTDWAEYFCRYSRDLSPFPARQTADLAGDNASYKREVLESVRDEYRDGFWENVVQRRLDEKGVVLHQTSELVVLQGRSAGFRAFAAQRLAHGRKYGHQRGVHFSPARNLIGMLVSPLVPFLMTLRVFQQVMRKRRYRLRAVASLPLIFTFNLVWAYAEARGHLDMLRR